MKGLLCAVCAVFLLAACSSGNNSGEELRQLRSRVERLEKQTGLLREGMKQTRQTLEAVEKGLARMGKGASANASGDAGPELSEDKVTKDELDDKARRFAGESLDRLLDLSRTVLDRLEQQLEQLEEEPAEPAPGPEGSPVEETI